MFSKACEYGIKSVIFIAEQSRSNQKVSLKTVANAIDSPTAYTSKILQLLTRHQIIISEKGPTGGFSMTAEKLDNVTLSTIVSAIDGDSIYKGCGLGLAQCNADKPCPVHDQFAKVREALKDMLENTSVSALSDGLLEGMTFLKR